MTAVSAKNPMRPVNWRWQRAQSIFNRTGIAASRSYDTPIGFHWIKRAVACIRAMNLARDEAAMARVAEEYPDIYWAYWIYDAPSSQQRYSIEAHLLAEDTFKRIADLCGTSADVIEAYEALFFNVLSKLRNRLYITNCVFGASVSNGLAYREQDVLWKMYGYFLGPKVLDAVETQFISPTRCTNSDQVGDVLRDDAIGSLKLKTAMAARTAPVAGHQFEILELFAKFVEIESSTGRTTTGQGALVNHIQLMINELPVRRDFRVALPESAVEDGYYASDIPADSEFSEIVQQS